MDTQAMITQHEHTYMCTSESLPFSPDREEFSLVNATFQIIQGGVIPMDITTVQTADGQTLYMTILSGWGMVADIDIESEKLRKIGDTRFILGKSEHYNV